MSSWSRMMWLALVWVLGGLLGALLLHQWAAPFRAGDPNPDLGPNAPVMLPLTFLLGALLGVCQWWLIHRANLWLAAVGVAMVIGFMALSVVDFFVEFTRAFPVPGGGSGLNPSAGELKAGLVYWGAFVLGAVLGVATANFVTHVAAARRPLR